MNTDITDISLPRDPEAERREAEAAILAPVLTRAIATVAAVAHERDEARALVERYREMLAVTAARWTEDARRARIESRKASGETQEYLFLSAKAQTLDWCVYELDKLSKEQA